MAGKSYPRPSGKGKTLVPFTKANLLAQLADCAISHYQAFETRASELRDLTQTFAADRSSDNGDAARSAWIETIALWEVAELFQFGPAARPKSPGAQDFRDNIYAFPLNNRCKIEEGIVSEAYAKVAERFANAPSQQELPSLEEELFAHVAAVLRKLSPYRKYVPAVLETALSPLATDRDGEPGSLRLLHL